MTSTPCTTGVRGHDAGAARPEAVLLGIALLITAGTAAVLLRWWILAALVSLLVGTGVLAAVAGLCVLTWLYLREVHRIMFGGDHPAEPAPDGREDPAHRGYHGGPAWWDLCAAVRRTWRASALWGVLLLPHVTAHALVVGAYLAAAWSLAGALRLVDTGLRTVRRIRMVCPECYRRLPYPAYLCGRCGRRHDTVRPGARGLLRRRCRCDRTLPTLILLGAADLRTLCPHCDRPLEHRPGEVREFLLPLFGGTGAGKTRLAAGLHLALEQAARHGPDSYLEPLGEEAARLSREGARVLAPDHRTRPTPPGRKVRAATARLGAGRRALVLQVFDAAGERFNRSATAEELAYLGEASTFVLVVDPLGIPAVWRCLTADERDRLAGERSHTRDPELAYGAVLDEVQRHRRAPERGPSGRLAVVVTRGDLVRGTSVDPGAAPVREWAEHHLGLGNLLARAEADFGSVQVFLTSAVVGPDGLVDPSLHTLSAWLLRTQGRAFAALARAPVPAPVPAGGAR
ncbi:TRAFAC clade GTPase domain-containing protein [Nocardiopsis protaetiae]|uniref:TRAFAC clade GTPase domain-containing protein n=1 Tax=Nocardiopsis protaetiae TaxID=3382270 RepID=UPI00387B47A2